MEPMEAVKKIQDDILAKMHDALAAKTNLNGLLDFQKRLTLYSLNLAKPDENVSEANYSLFLVGLMAMISDRVIVAALNRCSEADALAIRNDILEGINLVGRLLTNGAKEAEKQG